MPLKITWVRSLSLFSVAFLLSAGSVFGQAAVCSEVPAHEATPAEAAYAQGKYEVAESLYLQELLQKPGDLELNSALVHTLLHEGRIEDAWARANKAAGDAPRSASALTALAEVQLRKGQPWLAAQTLDSAAASDPCYARVHLVRSRIFRIDSMYASERVELEAAYKMDPTDADIHRSWLHTVNPANDIVRIEESLATMPNLEPEIREKASASATAMMSLLSENSQTCQSAPIAAPVTLPLLASHETVKQIDSYKIGVDFPKGKAKLTVDTAASGLYISRSLAESLGLQHAEGAPAGTVQADSIHIGALEFRNCMVGVSDTPFAQGVDGFIGTDVFAPYLVSLNFPQEKLELEPLPHRPDEQKNPLPGDRYSGPGLKSYTPVYHKSQYLLVPVMIDKKDRRLFVLDTGIRLSTMTPEVAHSVSGTRMNFTNSVATVSGSKLQIYRDSFDLQFANLSLDHKDHILEFDPSTIEQSAGMEVAGMLGFDILQSLVIHIDYRDGLVGFDSPVSRLAPGEAASSQTAAPASASSDGKAPACDDYSKQNDVHNLSSSILGGIVVGLDSKHLKVGQSIQVKVLRDWRAPSCALAEGSSLYGHVLAATASKSPGASELAIVFDHGDCSGRPKQQLSLRIVGVVGRDTTYSGVHSAMPTEVRGGAKSISATSASMGAESDDDTNGPKSIHTGAVVGAPHLKLVPEGGPQCSAMLTSEQPSVHLGTDMKFVLTMQSLPE
jgi:tetratricopeptide (TPR) repeat protein